MAYIGIKDSFLTKSLKILTVFLFALSLVAVDWAGSSQGLWRGVFQSFWSQDFQKVAKPSSEFSSSAASSEGRQFRLAPSFELKDSHGKVHRLSDYKGSLVVLHFWAGWCPPCLPEISQWIELAAGFQNSKANSKASSKTQKTPVQWIAVSQDSSWNDALSVLPDSKLPNHVISLLDSEGTVPDAFGTFQFPETYLISPDQKILHKWVGPQDWLHPELSDWLRQILKQIP
jgi:peroxiredoxin